MEVLQRRWLAGDVDEAAGDPTMVADKSIDLVQDVTADCSVVASLCAAVARAGDGFEKVASKPILILRRLLTLYKAHAINSLPLRPTELSAIHLK